MGRGLPDAPARHVRVRALGRAGGHALLRPRPLRDQAVLLHGRRRRPLLRLRDQGAAALPAGDRDRPGGVQGLPLVPVLPRRQDAVQGDPRAAARPLPPRPRRAGRDAALLGGLLRAGLRPHERLLRGADERADARVGRPPPARRRPGRRLRQRRLRLERRRHARGGGRIRSSCSASPASSTPAPPTTRARYARELAAHDGFPLAEIEIGPADFVENIQRVVYHLDYPVAGPGSFPAVHGLGARGQAAEGGARRPGRRRDLRRLHALPDRVLRAVHQGRDRRHDARRQLRRHLRVDHPEPDRARELQAAAAGVLARRALRRARRALLPADQPRARPRRRDRLVAARRLLAVRDLPRDLPRRRTSARSRTSTP